MTTYCLLITIYNLKASFHRLIIRNTFGIISIILCFIPIFNVFAIALSEPGIVFSALGIKSPFNRGKAISGLVLNIIAFVLGLILYIVYAIEFGIVLYE